MIELKDEDGFWKTKIEILDIFRELERKHELAIKTLKYIATEATALEALHASEKTLEELGYENYHRRRKRK